MVGNFSESLAAVAVGGTKDSTGRFQGGKWGYIDRFGKTVIAPQYDRAGEFQQGVARVRLGDATSYIDRTGKHIWEPSK